MYSCYTVILFLRCLYKLEACSLKLVAWSRRLEDRSLNFEKFEAGFIMYKLELVHGSYCTAYDCWLLLCAGFQLACRRSWTEGWLTALEVVDWRLEAGGQLNGWQAVCLPGCGRLAGWLAGGGRIFLIFLFFFNLFKYFGGFPGLRTIDFPKEYLKKLKTLWPWRVSWAVDFHRKT